MLFIFDNGCPSIIIKWWNGQISDVLWRGNEELSETIYTIGHSTRSLEEFTGLLKVNGVQQVADIRTVPRSRFNPQYNADTLPGELAHSGLKYLHLAGLGGLRHPLPTSTNTAWQNPSFRGFADYMQTDAFRVNLESLIKLAANEVTCLMCAEAVPWRCHRNLVSDALTVRGVEVRHILSPTQLHIHELTPFARVQDGNVTYPAMI